MTTGQVPRAGARAAHDLTAAGGMIAPSATVPIWRPQVRELVYRDQLVKQYRVPAENQEVVLSAFEERGWPFEIPDPLPQLPDGLRHARRRAAVCQSLNRNQLARLLRFCCGGSGTIRWSPAE